MRLDDADDWTELIEVRPSSTSLAAPELPERSAPLSVSTIG
jgi:hypothetical protein